MEFWATQALNALQLSMLLFLLSVGLTVIFGLMHFVNLAHGALYMLGAYIGVSTAAQLGFWPALAIAPAAVAGIGLVLYGTIVRGLRRAGPLNQVLVTFGLVFVAVDAARLIWGDIALGLNAPAILSGPVDLGGVPYPAYRLFVIALGFAVMAGLWLALALTPVGAMIRAAVENEAMAACLGIDVERLFVAVFCLGCALAGFAGVVAAPVFAASPQMATDILIPTLIVVVIGGLGSLPGAIVGSLTVGFLTTFGAVIVPALASLTVYALLAAVLIARPQGLIPARR